MVEFKLSELMQALVVVLDQPVARTDLQRAHKRNVARSLAGKRLRLLAFGVRPVTRMPRLPKAVTRQYRVGASNSLADPAALNLEFAVFGGALAMRLLRLRSDFVLNGGPPDR